jgi:hypothetical protein
VGVVDHPENRLLLGHFGEKAEHAEADDESIRSRRFAQAERRRQRVTLRSGQPFEQMERRCAELVQAGVRELPLVFVARSSRDAESGGASDQVVEQRRLADTGLATDDQHLAPAALHLCEQPIESVALLEPTA